MRNFILPILACLLLAGCSSVPFSTRERAGTCSYNQVTYNTGESFPSIDGCNACGCSENGEVVCTLKACNAAPVAQCQTAAECEGNAIDLSFCSNGSWGCIGGQCELSCDVSEKL